MAQNSLSAKQNAKRLHGAGLRVADDEQSQYHILESRTDMTRKNKNKKKQPKQVQKPAGQSRRRTPFRDAGEILGGTAGAFLGYPALKGLGRWLGSGIGSIFGSGDYHVVGPKPSYNVLMGDAQIPQFSSSRQTNIICHREYLTDIQGTANFSLTNYSINPGMASTFPWLATVAQNYQEYRIHGMVFEFRSLLTDFVTGGAPGAIIMATNYNADAANFTSKQEMENSEFAVATKPTQSLMHAIECATDQTTFKQRYIRTGDVASGQDLRTYDWANFYLATQGNPVQNLGELWVSYCVEFFKPILPGDIGGEIMSAVAKRLSISGSNPLGLINTSKTGALKMTVSPTTVTWPAYPGNKYVLSINWIGTPTALTHPTYTYTGLIPVAYFAGNLTQLLVPSNGVTNAVMSTQIAFTCTANSPGLVTVTLGSGGVYPTSAEASVAVTTVDADSSFVA